VVEAEYGNQVAILSAGELAALGSPHELRQRALGGESIEIRTTGTMGLTADIMEALKECSCMVQAESPSYDLLRLTVSDAASALPEIMAILQQNGVVVKTVESVVPAFDEAFVRLVEQHRTAA
jgi:ABC-2 type transport system ATP-binding protein